MRCLMAPIVGLAFGAAPARADRFCNPADSRAPCFLAEGSYHVRAPEGADTR